MEEKDFAKIIWKALGLPVASWLGDEGTRCVTCRVARLRPPCSVLPLCWAEARTYGTIEHQVS